jgi:hypothetical protein
LAVIFALLFAGEYRFLFCLLVISWLHFDCKLFHYMNRML